MSNRWMSPSVRPETSVPKTDVLDVSDDDVGDEAEVEVVDEEDTGTIPG